MHFHCVGSGLGARGRPLIHWTHNNFYAFSWFRQWGGKPGGPGIMKSIWISIYFHCEGNVEVIHCCKMALAASQCTVWEDAQYQHDTPNSVTPKCVLCFWRCVAPSTVNWTTMERLPKWNASMNISKAGITKWCKLQHDTPASNHRLKISIKQVTAHYNVKRSWEEPIRPKCQCYHVFLKVGITKYHKF